MLQFLGLVWVLLVARRHLLVTNATTPDGVLGTRRSLTGWGRTAASACDVVPVRTAEGVDRALAAAAAAGRSVVARGLARSVR